ncbi:sigma-70 family RNA polymerase sigma factor [Actinoplanes subtropicus]|uniref:sigma-70 family RNA polymerase sigma factor n=1 Tax=Actinoplanes subtropicus TaxID=543632 RepID=UPI00068EC374|nr:sigma-70 family RNA polymerase sigma factor [Actinoplanes subtropicus]
MSESLLERASREFADPSLSWTSDAVAFESARRRLFGIAYQMLGRASDAEDVVQEVWIRWQRTDRAQVRDRVAFLATVAKRAALNTATSAHSRREVSSGVGLPGHDRAAADPAAAAERREELELAMHLLLERLSPVERAVYVLREAFDYSFGDIADMLELSQANARQLACRARTHLAGQRQNPVEPAHREDLLEAFLEAAGGEGTTALIGLLTNEVVRRGRGKPTGNPNCAPDRTAA